MAHVFCRRPLIFSARAIFSSLADAAKNNIHAGSPVNSAAALSISASTDSGATWTAKRAGHGLGSKTVHGAYAVESTVYAATSIGLSISTDGGATFTTNTTANGLGGNTVRGVSAIGSTIYAATDGSLSISTNGGSTFTS
jgi:hypothetical protein